MRDVKFNLVLSKDERAALERLACDTGVSNADVIRQLILAAAKRLTVNGESNA